MKKVLLVLVALFLVGGGLQAERKKVGLVLSGGGATGAAHIGVLKVLEEAGIPIDYSAGTSMGSIVGGLYAIGYDAGMLDTLVRKQQWPFLLSNRVYRYDLPFSEKEKDEKYLVSIPMIGGKGIQVPSGFISGQNIYSLFSELTIGYHDSVSFLNLPIPFSCVAANLVNGKEVILDQGNLAMAMRSSMAIPGVFSPVVMDTMLLVDGGIANNFPTDVGKAMGADIIIGVDVSSELRKMNELNTAIEIVDQLTSFMGMAKYEDNIKLCDIYINPDRFVGDWTYLYSWSGKSGGKMGEEKSRFIGLFLYFNPGFASGNCCSIRYRGFFLRKLCAKRDRRLRSDIDTEGKVNEFFEFRFPFRFGGDGCDFIEYYFFSQAFAGIPIVSDGTFKSESVCPGRIFLWKYFFEESQSGLYV